jgi:hypothetical protein
LQGQQIQFSGSSKAYKTEIELTGKQPGIYIAGVLLDGEYRYEKLILE